MKHVSEKQLVAFRDGKDDPRVREHLASCEECQRTFDDSRFSLSLRRLSEPAGEGHPSGEELTAFWGNALSREPARRIQQHLRSCDRCLAVYRRMRGIEPARAYASPPPDLVRRVQKQFGSRPSPVDLGELWLRWIGGVLQLTREPGEQRMMASRVQETYAEDLTLTDAGAGIAETPHPSSASARRQRFEKIPTPKPKPKLSKPVHFEAGKLRVELQVVQEGDETRLRVRLGWADTGVPARGVPLRIYSDLGKDDDAETDNRGRAELSFPDGLSQLEILARTPITLRLNAAE